MGPQPEPTGHTRHPKWAVLDAEAAGLTVLDVRDFEGRIEFRDIAAVVHFLRKVIWIVPGFTVESHRERLRELHGWIAANGPFVATSARFLFEARRPVSRHSPG